MKTVGVISTSRADFGIYLPILRRLRDDRDFQLRLYVTGAHLVAEFGATIKWIEEEHFEIAEQIPILLATDDAQSTVKAMALAMLAFSQVFAQSKPDILLVLGDRFEMFASALAAVPFKIPIAHIHGGELTFGAMDDCFRHCLTKISHLHFVATEQYAKRVIQMGEDPERVIVSGAPSIDYLRSECLPDQPEIERLIGISLTPAPILITYHPATLESLSPEHQIREVLAALPNGDRPIVFTAPNADPGGRAVTAMIQDFIRYHPNAIIVNNLGTRYYFGMMRLACVMVGNSSSGLIEAPSFRLPVVNIGSRQDGRVRAANVIDVRCDARAITDGINRAMAPTFRESLINSANPYDAGRPASEIVVQALKRFVLRNDLYNKHFYDLLAKPFDRNGTST